MFKEAVIKQIKKLTGLDQINLEIPSDSKFGDFAFPCFILSKKLKKNPKDIAAELSEKIKLNQYIQRVESVGPYLNFFINKEKLAEITLKKILKEKKKYGSSNVGKNKKALVEHSSINPNAEPHVGRARNALIGDSIVRILKFQGYRVETHFFVNDIGKQIAMLVLASRGKKVSFKELLKIYVDMNNKIKQDPTLEKEVFDILYNFEKGNKYVRKEFQNVVNICIKGQKEILGELGIKYDFFDYESKYLLNKKIDRILKELLDKEECFKDSEGRVVINQEELSREMKSPYFVLTRSDGTSLYPLRDLAYTMDKMDRASDKNIVILGEDQKLYFKQIKLALRLLNYKSPEVVHYSFVLLKTGKMSTRKGEVVLLSDFMEESKAKARKEIEIRGKIDNVENTARIIGYGALKYSILKVSPEKNVIFDWNSALSFEGETAPYIQYSYARAASILRKANQNIGEINYSLFKEEDEIKLITELAKFPSIVLEATEELRPHLIAVFAYSLAKIFNEFYHSCPCIIEDKKLRNARLALVLATKTVIANALGLLGIESPEVM